MSLEARPLDCGVSSGLTFSAPVWPTNPQDAVKRISPNFPMHQASSFFYEDKLNLPPIAYYRLHKIKEYVGVKEKSVKRIHQKYRRWRSSHDEPFLVHHHFKLIYFADMMIIVIESQRLENQIVASQNTPQNEMKTKNQGLIIASIKTMSHRTALFLSGIIGQIVARIAGWVRNSAIERSSNRQENRAHHVLNLQNEAGVDPHVANRVWSMKISATRLTLNGRNYFLRHLEWRMKKMKIK